MPYSQLNLGLCVIEHCSYPLCASGHPCDTRNENWQCNLVDNEGL